MSRVARYEPSGSASGEEGGPGISVGVEEEEQAFSVRVRKKVSGVFWTVRKIGERGEFGGETEAGERVVCVYKARCTNYSLSPKNRSLLLRCCIGAGAWTWVTGHACRMHVPVGHYMRLVCY